MSKIFYSLFTAGVLAVILGTPARANLIVNGSFESPGNTSDFVVYGNGASIAGWTVQFDSVDINRNNVLGTSLVAHDGNQWLDLNGFARGGVNQFIPTVAGQDYVFRFWYSDNPFSNSQGSQAGVIKTGNWTIRDGITLVALLPLGVFSHGTATGADADWTDSGAIHFRATSSLTRIAFSGDAATGSTGPFIDNVSVTAVPEPSSIALTGAGLLAAGIYWRRRRRLS